MQSSWQFTELMLLLILSVAAVAGVNEAVAAKTSSYETDANKLGFKCLAAGSYPAALKHFNSAAKACPDSCEAHYGRAAALSRLGRGEEAAKEFKLALLLDPPPELKKRLEIELSMLAKSTGNSGAVTAAPSAVAPAELPSPSAADAERSISRILSQSEERIGSIHSSSERYATKQYGSKVSAQQKMMEQVRQELDAIRQLSRWGLSPFALADINQYEAEVRRKSDYVVGRARSDYDSRRRDAQSRARGVKESAEGLEQQMITRPSETSGVFLMPKGTNLYVRNYGHFDPVMPEPRPPLVPLVAVPQKLPAVVKMEREEKKSKPNKVTIEKTSPPPRDSFWD